MGISYGFVFTILPSIVSSIWGLPNFGRNFGALTYAALFGTPIFSYLFAFVSASHAKKGQDFCTGMKCWETTFWVCATTSCMAFVASLFLWKTWKGRL
jgi:MFS family permease